MASPIISALLKDRRSRKESRASQAKRLGINESTLRGVEAAAQPRRGTLLVISRALGLPEEATK